MIDAKIDAKAEAGERELGLLKTMLLIRRFEEASAEEYSAGKIRGFLHLYIGEEAVAAGVISALGPDDAVFATYREHGHALARGVDPGRIMAEMFGKVEGVSRGRGGSMHLFDKEHFFFGGNAIVAGALPVAAGYALGRKLQRKRGVTACFFGEGAMAEGEFHETMNLAALWGLPVLFVCENNLYAMGTALARSESQDDLCAKAASYNVKAATVDGMDVVAVHESAARAVRDVEELEAPIFLECKTYRFRAHSMFDPELYRDKAEVERWKARDPIPAMVKRLLASGVLREEQLPELENSAARIVKDAVAFAEAGTLEPVGDLLRFVTTEAPSAGRESRS